MLFLEPLLLLAMPLIGLPIVIHLLNQRRHKTSSWAATRFVRQATNMNRGSARLRHWFVLALRALAIAMMVFVMSRPLASRLPGLGFLAGQREQLIVMDRSPSMALQDSATGLTWRQAVLMQLQDHLETVTAGGKRILFHALSDEPVVVQAADLTTMLETSVTATQTDLPRLIENALDYIQTQALGPSDIWVCCDRQRADWQPESGRWNRIRERLESSPEVKLHVLMPEPNDEFNLAISASNVTPVTEDGKQWLLLDFSVRQTSGPIQQRQLPIQINVAGRQRNIEIELVASDFDYQQLRIELPAGASQGAGVIQLPSDGNAADNRYFFSYAPTPPHNSVVVSDSEEVATLVKLVCSTPPSEAKTPYNCKVVPVGSQAEIDWQQTGLVVWHAPLPDGLVAEQMESFVADGGTVLFLPTVETNPQSAMFGVRWGDWDDAESLDAGRSDDPDVSMAGSAARFAFQVAQWRTEDDLLATDESGRALPMKTIACSSRCEIQSENASMLASFGDGKPLLVRAVTDAGAAYFLSATPHADSSSFTDNGVAMYVMLHRALEQGAVSLARNRQLLAGEVQGDMVADLQQSKPLDVNPNVDGQLVAEDQRAFFAGAYQSAEKVIAVNRSSDEDSGQQIDQASLVNILGEDSFDVASLSTGSLSGVTNEIWKLFVVAMIVALLVEGWLSLPIIKSQTSGAGRWRNDI